MRWDKARRSENIQDQRGKGTKLGGKLTLGGVAIIVVLGLINGQDPMQILEQVANEVMNQPHSVSSSKQPPRVEDNRNFDFTAAILGDTEDTWRALFAQKQANYPVPTLVVFENTVRSACGNASSAMGPFYCPADQQVYIDLSFFRELRERFNAGGEFAQAYVIAHEVGHHVQTVLGISKQVQQARQQGHNVEGNNGLLVRQELQADCFAGIWAHHAQKRHSWLEAGDLEDALNAAQAIGDDRLQKQSQGYVVPDAFTHGTAKQREHWFKQGFQYGDMNRCDTFNAKTL